MELKYYVSLQGDRLGNKRYYFFNREDKDVVQDSVGTYIGWYARTDVTGTPLLIFDFDGITAKLVNIYKLEKEHMEPWSWDIAIQSDDIEGIKAELELNLNNGYLTNTIDYKDIYYLKIDDKYYIKSSSRC